MQVSWIDANHLQSLLAQIAPPEMCADTKPERVVEITTATGFMDEAVLPQPAVRDPLEQLQTAAVVHDEPAAEESAERDENEPEDKLLHNSAAALPLSRIRDKLRAIRQRATEAGILVRMTEPSAAGPAETSAAMPPVDLETLTEPASSQCIPALKLPQGTRTDRLAAFSAWAREVLRENGGHVLVMSDDGEVLWGGEAKAGLVLSSMMAWAAASRASAVSACGTPPVVWQPLSSGHVLTVIPCETKSGVFHAAVAAPEALSYALAACLRDALRDTLNAGCAIS